SQGRGRFGGAVRIQVGDRHRGTRRGELARDRHADPAPGAGHEDHVSREFAHGSRPPTVSSLHSWRPPATDVGPTTQPGRDRRTTTRGGSAMHAEYVRSPGGPGCLVQLLWFFFIGWWVTPIWVAVAWVLLVTIVGIPLGVMMLHRIPQVLALRDPS